MGKPALGKGMKDLLAKNIVLGDQETQPDARSANDELKTSIERFQAQEFDVSVLEKLHGKSSKEIFTGIEEYRDSVKKLITAQTIVRSLEGYGYTDELERIMENIKDPLKADKVLHLVEDLKERALTEHNMKIEKKDVPRVKLSEALKAQSEKLHHQEDGGPGIDDISLDSLDDMLSELNEIGEAFDMGNDEPDPILEEIRSWEEEGYFVDRLVTLLGEDRDAAIEEMKTFEQGVLEMRVLKERVRKMDLSGFPKQQEEIRIKFQYPHMASEIINELNAIDRKIEDSLKESAPEKEELPEGEEQDLQEGPIPPEEGLPEEPPGEEMAEEEPSKEEVPQEVPEDPIPEATTAEEEPIPPGNVPSEEDQQEGSVYLDLDIDQLMEKAKEMYRDGDSDRSLQCFEEILKRDPENSKARFMIRRLSAKQ